MIEPNSTPWRLLASLKTCLWAVLVLCVGMASASRTVEPLDLHQAAGLVQEKHAEGGCFFLRARWMDPQTGRFVSEDPFGGTLNSPSSLHRYLYAGQSPVNMVDPNGRFGLLEVSLSIVVASVVFNLTASSIQHSQHDGEAQIAGDAAMSSAKALVRGAIDRLSNPGEFGAWSHWSLPCFCGDLAVLYSGSMKIGYEQILSELDKPMNFKYLPFAGDVRAQAPWFGITSRVVYLAKSFMELPETGYDSKGGVLLHEYSHLVLGTLDFVYGVDAAVDLASWSPDLASMNADNYEFFAEAQSERRPLSCHYK